MTSWSKRFGVVVGFFAVTASSACGGQAPAPKTASDSAGDGHAEVGKPAPDLSIQTLNDKGKISLESLQGKVIVVDFWATWCGPCKQSFPKLEELSKKVSDKVVIVGVSVDDEKKGVAEFAKENGATFAIGWDEGHTIASKWKVGTMPTTFIVDATGKVRHIHDGYHDGETKVMEKELQALVDEGAGAGSDSKSAKSGDTKTGDSSDTKSGDTKTGEGKGGDAKGEGKTGDSADAAAGDEEATPIKKPGKKKGGKAPGKKKPKKKPAAPT